jgi:hypothetical protein
MEKEAMSTENDTRAGGDAQSKGVDDTQEQNRGGHAETKDVEETQGSQRAGGDAQSKGIS